MNLADIPKMAIIMSFGLFKKLFMPFDLRNVAQTFQMLMEKPFLHLPLFFTYLDNHIIASRILEEHLRQFFTVLQKNGLTINLAKCTFVKATVEFLGQKVEEYGVRLL